jgi:uncharacterized protein
MHVADLFKAHINTIHTDFSAWRNLFAEDAILEMHFGASAGIDTTLSGVDAIAESVGGFVGALRDPHVTIKNVYQIEGEESVVAEFAMTQALSRLASTTAGTTSAMCVPQMRRSLSTVNTSMQGGVLRLRSAPS